MGLFGSSPFKRAGEMAQPFMPTTDAETQQAVSQYAAMPAPQRGGLFGGKFAANMGNLAGGLAKAQAYIDGDWGAAQGIQTDADYQRKAELLRQQSLQQRQDGMADWVAKQQWMLANKPVNNDTVNDFNWYKSLSEQDRKLYQEMKPMYRQGPDGQFYRVEPANTAPPTFTPDDWETGTPLTGGTSGAPAGRTFR